MSETQWQLWMQASLQSMCMPPTRSCKLFPQRQHTVAQVHSGLQGLVQFTPQLLAELWDYLVGDVGVSRQLAGIWDCHCICFNLASLCRHPSTPHHGQCMSRPLPHIET